MAKNKKPRKPMTKRPVLHLPMVWRQSYNGAVSITLLPHNALNRLRDGVSDDEDLGVLEVRFSWTLKSLDRYFSKDEECMESIDCIRKSLEVLNRLVLDRKESDAKNSSLSEEFRVVWVASISDQEYELFCRAVMISNDVETKTTRRESRDTLKEAVSDRNAARKAAKNT